MMNDFKTLKLEPVKELDQGLKNFLNDLEMTIETEKINAIKTLTNQLFSHYINLIVTIQDSLTKEELATFTAKEEEYEQAITKLKENVTSLETINNLYQDIETSYNDLKTLSTKKLETNAIYKEFNDLIMKINVNLDLLANISIPDNEEKEIKELITNFNDTKDKEFLTRLLNKTQNLLQEEPSSKTSYQVFSLFTDITPKIKDTYTLIQNDLTYIKYHLIDNSFYYAIIKQKEDLDSLIKEFKPITNLILDKEHIIKTCEEIIKNIEIYYNIKEYVTFLIATKKEQDFLKYQSILTDYESKLKSQFSFLHELALLVNHKPSKMYPTLVYNGEPFSKSTSNTLTEDSLIANIFMNYQEDINLDTKMILTLIYDHDVVDDLYNANYNDHKKEINNYTKIRNYLNLRLKEMEELKTSSLITTTLKKEDISLYKDVNTIIDIQIAIIICDKTYKEGQGFYALEDYLKSNTLQKFTSKYGCRNLVKTINRQTLIKLLGENILKRYLLNHHNPQITSFLDQTLLANNCSPNDFVNKLITTPDILKLAIFDFNYNFLDSTSEDSLTVVKTIKNTDLANDNLTTRCINLLINIKKYDK